MAAFVENRLRNPPRFAFPFLAKGGLRRGGSLWKKACPEQSRRGGGTHSKRVLLAVAVGLLLLTQPAFESVARTPSPAELHHISEQAKSAFGEFLQLWQEERYFEMYEHGKRQSRAQLTMEEYATRMVELDWVPVGLETEIPVEIDYQFRTMLYVNATVLFQHKNYYDLRFPRKQSFLLIWEDNAWRLDLLQMIRSPYYAPIRR